jgi:hypothetical protein
MREFDSSMILISFCYQIPIISVVGNDACWSQIARDQVPLLGSIVGCTLEVR